MDIKTSFQHVSIGRVIKTHGTGGSIVVRLENPESVRLKPSGIIYFGDDAPDLRAYVIQFVRVFGSNARLELIGLNDWETALKLVQKTVWCSESDLVSPAPDTYYYYQLKGLRVMTSDGRQVGELVEIMKTGANDVYIVQSGDREHLIPAIRLVIQSIDLSAGVMVIEAIENMLELD